MKQIKLVLKKILIVYVLIYITLSQLSSCFARKYDKKCGEYARDFIAKYCDGKPTVYDSSVIDAYFTGGSFGSGTFCGCCSTGVRLMYQEALGVDLYEYDFDPVCAESVPRMEASSNWEPVTASNIQAGDIVISTHHVEMYAGNNENADFGNEPNCGIIKDGPRLGTTFTHAFRPTFDVNPTGSVPTDELEEENLSIYDENGFIYTGAAKLEGYKSSAPFGKWITKMITEIIDYIIGMITLIIRIVFVGITAIVERFIVDGIVNSVTGITNKRDESWKKDPNSIDEIDREVLEEEKAEEAQNQEQTPRATGDENEPNEYISEGMQGIADIGGKVQLKTSSKANVTIENIVYNKVPILDANFFNFESAGGAVVDQDGIIYILKENIAMWYYIFRTIAIATMLAVLIYLGIRMTISTVAEKKAVYKQMLLSWVVGFMLVFLIHYVMYAILYMNDAFLSWIIPKYEDGTEISLYETVRSKAYEIKASTGFTGMIMYMVLVYYGIRFLLVYLRRYFVITILALISPFMAVYYAIQRINGKGKGGQVYINWFKDFLYSVWIQAIHAIIYTLFIKTVLTLTETSLVGIFVAFLFLHFMVKMDPIVRDIFGLGGTSNKGELSVGTIGTQLAIATYIGGTAKKVGGRYGNYLGNTVGKPIATAAGRLGSAYKNTKDELIRKYGTEIEEETEEVENAKRKKAKEREERAQKRGEILKGIGTGLGIGAGIAMTGLKGAAAIPVMIAEPGAGAQILASTVASGRKIKETIEKVRKGRMAPKTKNGRYKLKGIQPRNANSSERLKGKLDALGVKYKEVPIELGGNAGELTSGADMVMPRGRNGRVNRREQLRKIETKDLVTSRGVVGKLERRLENNGEVTVKVVLDQKILEELTETEMLELVDELGKEDLQLSTIDQRATDILSQVAKEGDTEKLEQVTEIMAEAREKEEELAELYKEITGKEATNPEELNPDFIASLQRKRARELNNAAYVMSQPLSEQDIFRAIQNYQSKVPQFNINQERLTEQDIKGITTELNELLAKKGIPIEMNKEFMAKAEKELIDSHRRDKAKKESIAAQAEARKDVGSDVGRKADQQSVTEKTKSLKERVKDLQRKDLNNPNSEGNPNAPRSHGAQTSEEKEKGKTAADRLGTSSTDRLVKKLQNSSKGTESKTPRRTSGISAKTVEFSKKLEELMKLSEEAEMLTGQQLYTMKEVLERLEKI